MQYTSRGLIKIGKNRYCKNWDDLYKLNLRDTLSKQKRFKSKYHDQIKQVSYESYNIHNEKRLNIFMVASRELAGNKVESDLQKKAFTNTDQEVTLEKNRHFQKVNKRVIQHCIGELAGALEYQFNYTLLDDDIVDLETGEIVMYNEELFKIIINILYTYPKAYSVQIVNSLLIDVIIALKFKFQRIIVLATAIDNGSDSQKELEFYIKNAQFCTKK